MMTIETREGSYRICTSKVNACLPEWGWLCFMLGFFGALPLLGKSLLLMLFFGGLWGAGILGGVAFMVIMVIPFMVRGCGIEITLNDAFGKMVRRKSYKFTSRPDEDAVKIKEIIAEFTTDAKTRMNNFREQNERDKVESEKKQQCDARYEEIVEKARKL
jgi:hypothetical protein